MINKTNISGFTRLSFILKLIVNKCLLQKFDFNIKTDEENVNKKNHMQTKHDRYQKDQNDKRLQNCIKEIHMKNKVDYKEWHGLDNSFKQEKSLMKSFQGSTLSNPFWNTVKAFIGNKGTSSNDNIIIKAKNDNTINVKGNKLVPLNTGDKICKENLLVEMFNNHYI